MCNHKGLLYPALNCCVCKVSRWYLATAKVKWLISWWTSQVILYSRPFTRSQIIWIAKGLLYSIAPVSTVWQSDFSWISIPLAVASGPQSHRVPEAPEAGNTPKPACLAPATTQGAPHTCSSARGGEEHRVRRCPRTQASGLVTINKPVKGRLTEKAFTVGPPERAGFGQAGVRKRELLVTEFSLNSIKDAAPPELSFWSCSPPVWLWGRFCEGGDGKLLHLKA